MFYLDASAKFQGHDEDGLAIYGSSKPVERAPRTVSLDPEKIAQARADHEAVRKLLGETA